MTVALVFSGLGMVGGQADDDNELILRVAMQDDIRTTNPLNAGGVWTWNVIGYLYDGPINVDPETEELVPYIAVGSANLSTDLDTINWDDCTVGNFGYNPKDSWADENKSEAIIFYDFTGVTWHDGVQMTIRDILFSYHVQAQMPDWASSVNCLKNNGGWPGSSYPNDHKLYINLSWASDDDLQAALTFTLQEPFADFFRTTLDAFLLPYHIWGSTKGGQAVDNTKIWLDDDYLPDATDAWSADRATDWENPNPVGSGPFEWDFWDSRGGVSKITTYREHFYRAGFKYGQTAKQPNIDAILFKIHKTAESAVLALKNADVDYIAWSIPPTFVGELANEPGVTLQQSPEPGFFYMAYNMRLPSFGYDDTGNDTGKPLRRAVAHCIDKVLIVRRLLLSFGIAADGPISPESKWYNASLPKYDLDPVKAKRILADAGYQLKDGSTGQAAIDKASDGNWWVNPDGSPIGSSPGGKIEILSPQADYDPRPTSPGLMIAKQMRDVGINAESISMDFGSIVDRIDNRDFDMYFLRWRIGSDPTDFLHAFFHSSTAAAGQNYPGYQNKSFDDLIDQARQTGNLEERKQCIFDAQAAIAYDLPYNVLYFRTNIEAYRSDNFVGWLSGDSGSIYNWDSIYKIHPPTGHRLNAQFVSPPSSMFSNRSFTIDVVVKDQDRLLVKGAEVQLNASHGTLTVVGNDNLTDDSGRLRLFYTAPYVESNTNTEAMGMTVILEIEQATYTSPDGIEYDPAPNRLALIKVFPEGAKFLSVKMSANPDVIDPDVEEDNVTYGFTYIEVEVKDQNGDPAAFITVAADVDPAIPSIYPRGDPEADFATTDANGRTTFTLVSTNLPDDDDSIMEFNVYVKAISPDADVSDGEQSIQIFIVDAEPPRIIIKPPLNTEIVIVIGIVLVAISIAALALDIYYRKKSKR